MDICSCARAIARPRCICGLILPFVTDATLSAVSNLHYVVHQINLGLKLLPFPICTLAFLVLLHICDFGEGFSEIHFLRQHERYVVAVFVQIYGVKTIWAICHFDDFASVETCGDKTLFKSAV